MPSVPKFVENIVCVNNHYTPLPKGSKIRSQILETTVSYLDFECHICGIKATGVYCSKCGNCVLPFDPCGKCGKKLKSEGICSDPVC
jgi:hypothetical protein